MERAPVGAIYNVGGGAEVTMRDDRAARGDRGPGARLGATRRWPGDQRRTLADTTRIRAELGWEPRTPLDDGLRPNGTGPRLSRAR